MKTRTGLAGRRLTCLAAIRLITNWMTDGLPTGDDAGGEASIGEALAIRRWLDKRLTKITNAQHHENQNHP